MGGWHELAIAWLVHRPREVAADRGQSQVIGAILIFGFVIAGLGLYQVTVVPQQTGEVELQHSEAVKDDFSGVHGAIVDAGSANDVRTASVKLGTRYPPRALTLNPAPVYGRVAMDDLPGPTGISASFDAGAVCGSSVTPSSSTRLKTLTYKADYNRFSNAGSHGYETSVTYHAVDGKITDSSQVLIQGTTIRLLPLVDGSLSTSGITRKTLEFEGGATGGTSLSDADPSITLPTELSEDQWVTILSDVENIDSISKPDDEDKVTISLQEDDYTIRCTPIGEGVAPSNNPDLTPGTDDDSDGNSAAINPSGPGSVAYKSASMEGDNGVTITFENLDDEQRTITEARVPFYASDGQGGSGGEPSSQVDVRQDGDNDYEAVGGPYVPTDSTVDLAPESDMDNEGEIRVDFYCSDDSGYSVGQGDYFVLSLKFQNGETSNYFITPQSGDSGESEEGSDESGDNGNSGNNPC